MNTFDTLVQKYDQLQPRYTSYPTALQFNPGLEMADYTYAVNDSNGEPIPRPLSLYVHIPFCHSLCYYCGCHKIVTQNQRKIDSYLESLKQEIILSSSLFDSDRPVKQLHFGGGTPSRLSIPQIADLLRTMRQHFYLPGDDECDYSIELDPRTVNKEYLSQLRSLGINRINIGVQDFDPKVQSSVNRLQSEASIAQLIHHGRALAFNSIGVDLIYGLPHQTGDRFNTTLEKIIRLAPDRIAAYSYAHMPNRIKSHQIFDEANLPKAHDKLELLLLIIGKLTDAGYLHIGMDHFALPKDSLAQALQNKTLHRNFQGYSTQAATDLIGLGVSSIGQIGDLYVQNVKSLTEYRERISNKTLALDKGCSLSGDDHCRRTLIHTLMCYLALNFRAFSEQHNINFKIYFADELEQLKCFAVDGLIHLGPEHLSITPIGRLFMRNIVNVFDVYNTGHPTNALSKAI